METQRGPREIKISVADGVLTAEGIEDFDTDHIFDCGQCFRWQRNEDGSYSGIAFGLPARIGYDADSKRLMIHGADEKTFETVWREYLDLDRDYSYIKKTLAAKDETIRSAIDFGHGIRILNQEKWETMISFIISQNNNIPRIKKCIETLAETLGEFAGEFEGKTYYSLPSPERLAKATVDDLAPCRLGYRDKYLIETAKQVLEHGTERLEALSAPDFSAEETCEALQEYCGVGPKVASCIALFCMGKQESFPIDTWVRKVMNRLYGIAENDRKTMAGFAAEAFGAFGGMAQQYLFYYITHHDDMR